MDNNYEQDYGMDNSHDKQSYGKDNSYYKSKHGSNIKCNNINVNLNGDIDIGGASEALSTLATEAQAAENEGEIGANSLGSGGGGRPSGSDSDFRFVCINNNTNNEEKDDGKKDTCAADVETCFRTALGTNSEEFTDFVELLQEEGILITIGSGDSFTFENFEDFCTELAGRDFIDLQNAINALINAFPELFDELDAEQRDTLIRCIASALEIEVGDVGN